MMSELDPVAPDMVSLEVVGRNRPWSGRRPWSGSSERAVVERAEEESRRSSAQRRTPGTMGSVTEDEERERMEGAVASVRLVQAAEQGVQALLLALAGKAEKTPAWVHF